MILSGPNEHVIEVDDEYSINKLKKKGYKEATKTEVDKYRQRVEEAMAKKDLSTADNGVFYQTVQSSPNGYGMSRDIIKSELFAKGFKLEEYFAKQKIGLLYSYPNAVTQMRTDVRLIMTMFESDKIPEDWPEYLKMADEVIVPSKWCADVFAKSGVKATVVPLGYNDKVFTYQDRPVPVKDDKPFTFIHYQSFNQRKGFSEVFKAFNEEFKHNENVRLILKTTEKKAPIPIMPSEYPNIEVVTDKMPEEDLLKLLRQCNCMVYPSRGEGFGITPLEAMATGMPAIVPNAHGISEYFNSNYMLEVKVSGSCPGLYRSAKGHDVGKMVICDVEDLKKQMRHAFNNQAEMKELGKSASEYVKRFTYEKTAEALADILKKWQKAEIVRRTESKFLQVEPA